MSMRQKSELRISKARYVKGMFLDRIRLSGTAGGAKYVIGVPNPLNRARHVSLGRRHLIALDVLLSFASRDNFEEAFTVSKAAFVERFGSESAWIPLLELLGSWFRIQNTGYPVYATLAEVLIVTSGGQVDLSVRFSSSLALILKVLLSRSQEQISDSSSHHLLEAAYARGRQLHATLEHAEGGSISVREAGMRLGISPVTVLRRYRARKLIGWRDGKASVRLPIWQFAGRNLLPGLSEILAVANARSMKLDDYGLMLLLLSNRTSLKGRRMIDLLRSGDLEKAKLLAGQS